MAEFFAMGGYAVYVWGSYGVTALLMITEVVLLVRRKRTIQRRVSRIRSMEIGVKHEAQT